jgi:hypothetical protein
MSPLFKAVEAGGAGLEAQPNGGRLGDDFGDAAGGVVREEIVEEFLLFGREEVEGTLWVGVEAFCDFGFQAGGEFGCFRDGREGTVGGELFFAGLDAVEDGLGGL